MQLSRVKTLPMVQGEAPLFPTFALIISVVSGPLFRLGEVALQAAVAPPPVPRGHVLFDDREVSCHCSCNVTCTEEPQGKSTSIKIEFAVAGTGSVALLAFWIGRCSVGQRRNFVPGKGVRGGVLSIRD